MSDVLAEEVRALGVPFGDPDWDDVCRRAVESRSRSGTRRWAALAAALLLVVLIGTGVTLAATGAFRASPAPPNVVDDFGAYATQLGFHPSSHRAQLVAVDSEDYRLYATPNREGAYCIVTATPWRAPGQNTGDGGICVPSNAAEPVAAAMTASSGDTSVIAGRVLAPGAARIHFQDTDGAAVERPVGASGFFIAAVHRVGCADWTPTFVATDADGRTVATARITLLLERGAGVCQSEGTPHGP